MAFFSKFPALTYDFALLQGEKVAKPEIVTDIFKRIAIKQNLEKVAAIFTAYTVKDTDTPDIIAHKLYGSSQLHWLVMLPNEIINPFFDWPMTDAELHIFVNKIFKGSTFFWDPATIANGNFLVDQEITTTTGTARGTVTNVDVTLSSLVVENIEGTFFEGDTLEQDIGTLPLITAELTRRVQFTRYALNHFDDAQRKPLNPLTYRDGYIQGGNGFPPAVNVVTNEENVKRKNEATRNIQLIRPTFVDMLLRDLETVFRRNATGRLS